MPSLFACWEAMGQAIGKAVATAVTWICLVPLFYLVFRARPSDLAVHKEGSHVQGVPDNAADLLGAARPGQGSRRIPEAILMNILGISAFYHDSAAALVSDGRIVAAAQEERFRPQKA